MTDYNFITLSAHWSQNEWFNRLGIEANINELFVQDLNSATTALAFKQRAQARHAGHFMPHIDAPENVCVHGLDEYLCSDPINHYPN